MNEVSEIRIADCAGLEDIELGFRALLPLLEKVNALSVVFYVIAV
jgi:hypothetical protein